MKIPFPFEELQSEFLLKKTTQFGTPMVLVIPQYMGTRWTKDTLIFRSSVWTEAGELVSASFPKFFNWNEKDNLVPPPDSLIHTTAVEKIDGSTLIVSKFEKHTIIRTRGTFDVGVFENANEVEILKQRHPKAFQPIDGISYIYEWYSPANKIVLNLGDEPLLFLVGAIAHADYSLLTQYTLDMLSDQLGVPRPSTMTFSDIDTLLADVSAFKGKEGVCLYYEQDQHIKKVKGAAYLALHAFKSDLSINNLLEVYVEQGRPSYTDFYNYIAEHFDYECAEAAKGSASILCDANKEAVKIVDHMIKFAKDCEVLSRKEAAAKIISSYGKTSRAGFVFTLLDGKPLDIEAYKKLLHQVIPK
jgi:hypothetical protein